MKPDHATINKAALANMEAFFTSWNRQGHPCAYITMRNAKSSRRMKEFRLIGHGWADLQQGAAGASGPDPVSAIAWLGELSREEAAAALHDILLAAGVQIGAPAKLKLDARDQRAVNMEAVSRLPQLMGELLDVRGRPTGWLKSLNPDLDKRPRSVRMTAEGEWRDDASGVHGSDPISFVAYRADVDRSQAAALVAQVLNQMTGAAA